MPFLRDGRLAPSGCAVSQRAILLLGCAEVGPLYLDRVYGGKLAMWVRVAITIVLLLLPTVLQAQGKRIALLIGNKDYKVGVGALTNPLNDIRIVGDALRSVGFEVLKPVENAQRSAMLVAIYAFAAKLKAAGPDAVEFLYYSGHVRGGICGRAGET